MQASRFRTVAAAMAGAISSTTSYAHDGHGAVAAEWVGLHWLLEPPHALTVLAAMLLVVVAGRLVRAEAVRRRRVEQRSR